MPLAHIKVQISPDKAPMALAQHLGKLKTLKRVDNNYCPVGGGEVEIERVQTIKGACKIVKCSQGGVEMYSIYSTSKMCIDIMA